MQRICGDHLRGIVPKQQKNAIQMSPNNRMVLNREEGVFPNGKVG